MGGQSKLLTCRQGSDRAVTGERKEVGQQGSRRQEGGLSSASSWVRDGGEGGDGGALVGFTNKGRKF